MPVEENPGGDDLQQDKRRHDDHERATKEGLRQELFDHLSWAHIRFPNPGAIRIRARELSADTAGRVDRVRSCDAGG